MKKIQITIEEHLSKTITLEVPDDLETIESILEYSVDAIKKMYRNEEIVLYSDDYNGVTLACIFDEESQTEINWFEL